LPRDTPSRHWIPAQSYQLARPGEKSAGAMGGLGPDTPKASALARWIIIPWSVVQIRPPLPSNILLNHIYLRPLKAPIKKGFNSKQDIDWTRRQNSREAQCSLRLIAKAWGMVRLMAGLCDNLRDGQRPKLPHSYQEAPKSIPLLTARPLCQRRRKDASAGAPARPCRP
jgi:hypothetical protein